VGERERDPVAQPVDEADSLATEAEGEGEGESGGEGAAEVVEDADGDAGAVGGAAEGSRAEPEGEPVGGAAREADGDALPLRREAVAEGVGVALAEAARVPLPVGLREGGLGEGRRASRAQRRCRWASPRARRSPVGEREGEGGAEPLPGGAALPVARPGGGYGEGAPEREARGEGVASPDALPLPAAEAQPLGNASPLAVADPRREPLLDTVEEGDGEGSADIR
jgi:hypothetical protein